MFFKVYKTYREGQSELVKYEILKLFIFVMSLACEIYRLLRNISNHFISCTTQEKHVTKCRCYLPWLTICIIYLYSIKRLRVIYNLEALKTAPRVWNCRPGCRNGKTGLRITAETEKNICVRTCVDKVLGDCGLSDAEASAGIWCLLCVTSGPRFII